jgi:hypothetical protein
MANMPDSDLDDSKLGSLGGGLDALADDYAPSPIPAGLRTPSGTPPAMTEPKPLADMTKLNTFCLRGPCRYLLESTSPADVIAGSYEAIETGRTCLVQPGTLMEVKAPVYSCSHWDPVVSDASGKQREKRRLKFIQDNPECLKEDAEREARRRAQREKIDREAAERQRELDMAKAQRAADIEKGEFEPQ